MKKLFLLALCTCFAFTLVGCNHQERLDFENKMAMQVVVTQNSISQNFMFPAFAKYFAEHVGEEGTQNYTNYLCEQISKNIWRVYFLNYLAIYSLSPDEKYTPGGKELTIVEVNYNEVDDMVEFAFKFNSLSCWEYYHPSDEDDKEDDSGINFIETSSSEGIFPFCQELDGNKVGDTYTQIIKDTQKKHFSEEQVDGCPKIGYVYDYVTYHKRVHSNADSVIYQAGNYHHVWQSDNLELAQDKTIILSTNNANRGWWYLVVLIPVVVLTGGICLGIWIYQRNKNKKVVKKEG